MSGRTGDLPRDFSAWLARAFSQLGTVLTPQNSCSIGKGQLLLSSACSHVNVYSVLLHFLIFEERLTFQIFMWNLVIFKYRQLINIFKITLCWPEVTYLYAPSERPVAWGTETKYGRTQGWSIWRGCFPFFPHSWQEWKNQIVTVMSII